jgi:hypothetical protein
MSKDEVSLTIESELRRLLTIFRGAGLSEDTSLTTSDTAYSALQEVESVQKDVGRTTWDHRAIKRLLLEYSHVQMRQIHSG